MLLNTLGQLLSKSSQVGSLVKGNTSAVTTQLSANTWFVNFINPAQGGSSTPPKIGWFQQIDPLADQLSSYSPYHNAYNDPIGLIDFMGLAGINPCNLSLLVNNAKSAAMAAYKPLQEVIVTGVRKLSLATKAYLTMNLTFSALKIIYIPLNVKMNQA